MGNGTVDATKMVEQRRKLESYKDQLVERVESFSQQREQQYGLSLPPDKNKLGNTQFQDLIGKANSTESVKEIINFIRYQVGRDTKKESWAKDNFGSELIGQIEAVGALESDRELRMQLTRLFLGYLQRHVRYLRA